MKVALAESTAFATAATPAEGTGRLLVQVITPGWGSSGYYSQAVLEQAAKDRIWPAGTHMYADHPAESEQFERPERTIRDLAAVTTEDARWDATASALVAEVRVFSWWRQPLAEMADIVGVSIRGGAEGEMGEAEGRRGRVFSKLIHGESIDFVTHAGRGGKVLQVLESARRVAEARNVGQWVESRIHRDFTVLADEMFGDGRLTREERITLSGGIGDALAAFVARIEADAPDLYTRDIWDEPPAAAGAAVEAAIARGVAEATANDRREQLDALVKDTYATTDVWAWVRDFDDTTVWFEVGNDGTFQQSYDTTSDVATALSGDRVEVRVKTTYVPVSTTGEATSVPTSPAGQSTANESQEDTMATTQIEESRLAQLEKDAGRAPVLETERETAIKERDAARAEADTAIADAIIAEADVEFDDLQKRGLMADLPRVAETGRLDANAFKKTVTEHAAKLAEAGGAGTVRGLGGTTTSDTPTGLSESAFAEILGLPVKGA